MLCIKFLSFKKASSPARDDHAVIVVVCAGSGSDGLSGGGVAVDAAGDPEQRVPPNLGQRLNDYAGVLKQVLSADMGGSSLLGRTHPVAVFGKLGSAAKLLLFSRRCICRVGTR